MTRAERLRYLLEEINNKKTKPLLNVWIELFEVSNIFEVYDRLLYVKKEIDAFDIEIKLLKFDNNEDFKNIIITLNSIVGFASLSSPLSNQNFLETIRMGKIFSAFNMFQTMEQANHIFPEKEEDIPIDEFISFKENIEKIISEIEASNILEADKLIFLSIFHDLNKGISLYKINGLNAFYEVLRDNICKIKMISDIDEKNEENNKFKLLTKKMINKVWIWSITYANKKTQGLLDSKITKYLDEWAGEESPNNNSNDIEDTEIEE